MEEERKGGGEREGGGKGRKMDGGTDGVSGEFLILPISLLQGAATTFLLCDHGRTGGCASAQGCCCLNIKNININIDPFSRLENTGGKQSL